MENRKSHGTKAAAPTFEVAALGSRIKAARLSRHLPMRAVAQMAGVSVTHISQIERGRNCPTIGALARIASALGTTLHYFLEAEPLPEVRLALRGGTPEIRPNQGRSRLHGSWISEGISGGRIHVVRGTLAPAGKTDAGETFWVPALQTFYVLGGRLEILVGQDRYAFSAGDAFVIQPAVRFGMHNPGPDDCEILSVVKNEQTRWIPGRGELVAHCLEEMS